MQLTPYCQTGCLDIVKMTDVNEYIPNSSKWFSSSCKAISWDSLQGCKRLISAGLGLGTLYYRHSDVWNGSTISSERSSNVIYLHKHAVRRFLEQDKRMKIEPSAAHTQSLNQAAEHSGCVVKNKTRTMREGSKLPRALWPEINRTLQYTPNRKSLYECFHTYLAFRDGIAIEHRKPWQAHLRVYGCKAYALTAETQEKLNLKAWIGFLIGCDSTNNYHVETPDKVIEIGLIVYQIRQAIENSIKSQKSSNLIYSSIGLLWTRSAPAARSVPNMGHYVFWSLKSHHGWRNLDTCQVVWGDGTI